QSFRPKALVVPVSKDASTLQYVTRIGQRTPLVPVSLVVDLGGQFLWVDCEDPGYVSSTYRPARCGSAQCSLARASGCGECNSSPRPGFNRKFAICLASSPSSSGVIFFGPGPYNLLPGIDASASLTYTPLFINPVSTASAYSQGEPSSEYFIGVKSIT
ncbi:hypothetical protein CRG98_048021, partial [Punica granatum]